MLILRQKSCYLCIPPLKTLQPVLPYLWTNARAHIRPVICIRELTSETTQSSWLEQESPNRISTSNFLTFLLDPIAESFYNVNYGSSIITSKSLSKNISNQLLFFFVFKKKCELKCQNELFLKYHFSGNTSISVFITEIIWLTFDILLLSRSFT